MRVRRTSLMLHSTVFISTYLLVFLSPQDWMERKKTCVYICVHMSTYDKEKEIKG